MSPQRILIKIYSTMHDMETRTRTMLAPDDDGKRDDCPIQSN